MNEQRGVGAVISNDKGEILMLNHKKLDAWTIPMGKVEPDEDPNVAIARELFEEVGIKDMVYYPMIKNATHPCNIQGVDVDVEITVYRVYTYSGAPFNKEPDKHYEMKYMPIEDIVDLRDKGMVSKITEIYLKYLNR